MASPPNSNKDDNNMNLPPINNIDDNMNFPPPGNNGNGGDHDFRIELAIIVLGIACDLTVTILI